MKTFAEVISDLPNLFGLPLQSISGRATPFSVTEVDVYNDRLLLDVGGSTKTRPLDELQNIWTEMLLRPAVHVDSFLGGSGSSRNQPETILANLPYVEHLMIDNKKHVAFVGKNTHEYGTIHPMNQLEAEDYRQAMHSDNPRNPAVDEDMDQLLSTSTRVEGGNNYLLYGVPGSGKSYTVRTDYCDDSSRMERVVFHPDFTYSDFVGQILPKMNDDKVTYSFIPGPFTKILKKAYWNPEHPYFLVVEEINRGNAPAIFGEVFQLLDRDQLGNSEYGITNSEIASIVYEDENKKVLIPSNLSIVATMNTSDQNVFTLDTAFQRRWRMRMIENDLEKIDRSFAEHYILDTTVTWKHFNQTINNIILDTNTRMSSSEDKRLGAYFINPNDLDYNDAEVLDTSSEEEKIGAKLQNSIFPEKVIKYLWDDAFKFTRDEVFEASMFNCLEVVIRHFREARGNQRFKVFGDGVYSALVDSNSERLSINE
jgi:5-methylcytosine-specific restriction endonuclease McrBC GTP-binding regulatory subunit McrB